MELHRSDSRPEWIDVPHEQLNFWQRLAARTAGIVTPGNLLTSAGLIIAIAGLLAVYDRRYGLGIIGLVVGRLLDIADGWAADRTGTKSPLGEAFDATVDKSVTLATVIVLGVTRVVPWWALIILLAPQTIITLIGGVSNLRGRRLHPSRSGKVSMALCWVALTAFLAGNFYTSASYGFSGIGYTIATLSTLLSLIAILGYIRDSRTK